MASNYKKRSEYQGAYESPNGADPFASQLYSYWKLNGDADDAVGNVDMTEVNSPSYVTGLVFSQAVQLVDASSQYLQNLDVSISPQTVASSDIFTLHAWVKWTTFDVHEYIFLGGTSITAALSWAGLLKNATTNTITGWASDGTTNITVTSGAVTTGSWISFFLWHDGDNKVRLQIDDDTPLESSGSLASAVNTADDFLMGASTSGANRLNADLGPCAYWAGRALSASERADYYNGGSGRIITL